jgi:hypothetical protein
MVEDMDGLTIQFDRVKIPSGGGIAWELPAEEGKDSEVSKEIVGVIVDHHKCNAYYAGTYGDGGTNKPPDCSSMDAVTGYDQHGEARSCATCPFNQFGSDPRGGNGKACKNMHRVYLLKDGDDAAFPWLITIPPTSVRNFANWMGKRVVSHALRSFDVITKLTLSKAESVDKITYSQVNFSVAGALNPSLRNGMRAYSQSIKGITRQLRLSTADYNATGESDDNVSYPEPGAEDKPTVEVYKGPVANLPDEPNF